MILRVVCLFTAFFLAACAGSGSGKRYYVLTPDGPAPSGGGTGLGVGPVSLAAYIDRPNLIVQQGPNELAVASDHQWAGDLEDNIARTMAANLGRRLKTGNVRTYPWQRDNEIRYQISLDVRQLHSAADGYAVIEAGWRVYQLPERKLITSRSFSGREALGQDGYQAMVAAQSALLSAWAREIAGSLR
ncbi:MAG: membrane integrity-associated transporter subunit PqiC [Verrucomicrobia bacterium]|nr:MAG: membrane integrity-associated transporter subunit PqiC [Verrucomicrobiota bacterium]